MRAFQLLFAVCLFVFGPSGATRGQDAFVGTGAEHVPFDAMLASRMNVKQFLKTPGMEWLPIEIAEAWSKDMLGLDPMTLVEIKTVQAVPAGPQSQPLGFVATVSEDYDPSKISAEILAAPVPKTVDGKQVYVIALGERTLLLHAISPRKLLLATETMFPAMLAAAEGEGAVADLIRENPIGDRASQVVLSVATIRPLLMSMLESAEENLPPELYRIPKLPILVDSLVVETGSRGKANTFQIEFICGDADAASEAKEILDESMRFGRMMAVGQISQNIQGDGRMPVAQRAYVARMANYIFGLLKPSQENDRVVVRLETEMSVATTGVLVGLLLPAVQAAREAARRAQAANNLRQIALAMHNYHAANKKFPPLAIKDTNGKPVLSWRVAILPYLDQQALYQQFRLNEPWDSEHNIRLVPQMSSVFEDPSLRLAPGHTVFRLNVGENNGFSPSRDNTFRSITDGTVHTIMMVEADASEAAVWTKPGSLSLKESDPMFQVGHIHPGGFHAVFFDGSVRFLRHDMDIDTFKAMLTCAGREVIDQR